MLAKEKNLMQTAASVSIKLLNQLGKVASEKLV
jgi:hypothetical protein